MSHRSRKIQILISRIRDLEIDCGVNPISISHTPSKELYQYYDQLLKYVSGLSEGEIRRNNLLFEFELRRLRAQVRVNPKKKLFAGRYIICNQ